MDTKRFPAEETADLLGTNVESLRNWRRLPAGHPRHLGAMLVGGRYMYDANVILAWLNRAENVAYKELILASFVPDGVRDWFDRHTRYQQQATQTEGPAQP